MFTRLLAILACVTPLAVNAVPITFSGTTTQADAEIGVAVGDSFVITIDYDLSSLVPLGDTGTIAQYDLDGTVSVQVGSYTASGSLHGIGIANNGAPGPRDEWMMQGLVGPASEFSFMLLLQDASATAINNTAFFLPSSTTGYSTALWRVKSAVGTIDSIAVPEPSTLALLGAAALGFGFLRRKKRV